GSLFAAAAELGATISQADARSTEILKTFGMRVGTAYQIYDDCLDIAGNEGTTGKTLGTDLRKGKFTLPVLIFLRAASEFERECSDRSGIDRNFTADGHDWKECCRSRARPFERIWLTARIEPLHGGRTEKSPGRRFHKSGATGGSF